MPRPSLDKTTQWVIKETTHSALQIFQQSEFRALLYFEKLKKNEQDRIFNELTVSALVLMLLMLSTLESIIQEGNHKNFIYILRARIPKEYADILRKSGISEKNISLWEKLIAMRYDEYQKEYSENREQLPKIEENNPWTVVVAVGCMANLRRGKLLPHDPLSQKLLGWMKSLAATLEKHILQVLRSI